MAAYKIRWLKRAVDDIDRHFEYGAGHSVKLAETVLLLADEINKLLFQIPRIGSPLTQFHPRKVRRWLIHDYEIRYEIRSEEIVVLRVFHTKEDR